MRLIMLGLAGAAVAAAGGGFVLYVRRGSASTPTPAPASEAALVMVERDVPQTRNFDPIVNHEAMVVNVSSAPVVVDVVSRVPEGLNVTGKFYPAFGDESLLAVPMESPFDLAIKQYNVLGKPEMSVDGSRVEFAWRGVRIDPGEAAVAQYDNYFGPRERFATESGLRVGDLDVACTYDAEARGRDIVFRLDYTMKNLGQHPIDHLMLGVFLPDTILAEDGREVKLVDVVEVSAPPWVDVDRTSTSDGRGRMTQGSDFYMRQDELAAGREVACSLRVRGSVVQPGDIHPLLTIQAKSEGARLWPATTLACRNPLTLKTFYYRHLSLVLPDPCFFRIEPDGTVTRHR